MKVKESETGIREPFIKGLRFSILWKRTNDKGGKTMFRVAATNIQRVKYCPTRKLLEVQFKGEECIYQYFDVPEDVWYNMKNTVSMDMFFNVQMTSQL